VARLVVISPIVRVDGPMRGQAKLCEQVLRALPQWFGMEVGILNYMRKADSLPSFVGYLGHEAVGLALVVRHFEHSAELDLMAVLPEHHNRGVGRAMLVALERWLASLGVRFLQVKTLAESCVNADYEKTRRFYLAVGFEPLEELPTVWDTDNPCLILIKHLPRITD
jgi:GNAT superfamily N-acetyltransferase